MKQDDKAENETMKKQVIERAKNFLIDGIGEQMTSIDGSSSLNFKAVDMKIDKYNIKLEINDKKPMLRKYSLEFDVLLPQGEKLLNIHVKREFSVNGTYEKRIDIPVEAINAPEVTITN